MNGFPNAIQKRWHSDLRQIAYDKFGGRSELHHIMGARWKLKGFDKPGEFLVIMLTPEIHADIKNYSFESERALFLESLRSYQSYYGKLPSVPSKLVEHYIKMKSRQHRP